MTSLSRIHSLVALFAVVLIGLAGGVVHADTANDIYWDDSFVSNSPNQYTDAIVPHGANLYMGGLFQTVGDMSVFRIARWDGKGWHKLADGVGTPTMGLVHTIAIEGNVLYAGGMFDQVGPFRTSNIAMYDIDNGVWVPLAGGTSNAVRNISIADNGDVYAVGEFSHSDGSVVPSRGVARWDGREWHDVGGSLVGPRARGRQVVAVGDRVYVGGIFQSAGGVTCNNVGWWDGAKWHAMGDGVNNLVTAITVYDNDIYVGGAFTRAGGVAANRIARWDGERWHALGIGLSGPGLPLVYTILVDGKDVYAGGFFTNAGAQTVNYIARWDGADWNPLGSGMDDQVRSLTMVDGVLYVGGQFKTAGGKPSPHLSMWTKNQVTTPPGDTPAPEAVTLDQNVPNPFNPNTMIAFTLPTDGNVTLEIFTIRGQRIRTLVSGLTSTGRHEEPWDGRDDRGARVGTGMYFYRLTTPGQTLSRKMILLK